MPSTNRPSCFSLTEFKSLVSAAFEGMDADPITTVDPERGGGDNESYSHYVEMGKRMMMVMATPENKPENMQNENVVDIMVRRTDPTRDLGEEFESGLTRSGSRVNPSSSHEYPAPSTAVFTPVWKSFGVGRRLGSSSSSTTRRRRTTGDTTVFSTDTSSVDCQLDRTQRSKLATYYSYKAQAPPPPGSSASFSTVGAAQCPGLPSSSTGAAGLKPIAFLKRIKKQASALVNVRPSSFSPGWRGDGGGNHPYGYVDAARHGTTYNDNDNRLTVSFAPTPEYSASTFTRSSADDCSFLSLDYADEEDVGGKSTISRSGLGARGVLRHGKSMPALATLFRNRNANFVYDAARGVESVDGFEYEASRVSLETANTTTTGTTTATTTTTTTTTNTEESGDFIPYIPLVLQHEKRLMGARAVASPSRSPPHPTSYPTTTTTTKRTTRTRTTNPRALRETPSPTPSYSDGSAESIHSPITPNTSVFPQPPSITFTASDDADVDLNVNVGIDAAGADVNVSMASLASYVTAKDDVDGVEWPVGVRKMRSNSESLFEEEYGVGGRREREKGWERITAVMHPYAQMMARENENENGDEDEDGLAKTPVDTRGPYERKFEVDTASVAYTLDSRYSDDSFDRSDLPPVTFPTRDSAPYSPADDPAESIVLPSPSYDPAEEDSVYEDRLDAYGELERDGDGALSSGVEVKPQPTIGFGRQTVDPRLVNWNRKSGVSSLGHEEKRGVEWTLFLGDRAEIEGSEQQREPRRRVVSSGDQDVRLRTQSLKKKISMRQRADEGLVLPFGGEAGVQKPLLRVQALVDVDGESCVESEEERVGSKRRESDARRSSSGKPKEKGLRRSGSAYPVLGGGSTMDRWDDEELMDSADWTLMLPLPMSMARKSSVSQISVPGSGIQLSPSPNSNLNSKKRGVTTRNVTKARSSADLSAGTDVLFGGDGEEKDRKGVKMPFESLKSIKNELRMLEESKAILERLDRSRRSREEREELYASVVESNRSSGGMPEGGQEGSGNRELSGEEVSQDKRDGHRRMALDALSGNSPASSKGPGAAEFEALAPSSDNKLEVSESVEENKPDEVRESQPTVTKPREESPARVTTKTTTKPNVVPFLKPVSMYSFPAGPSLPSPTGSTKTFPFVVKGVSSNKAKSPFIPSSSFLPYQNLRPGSVSLSSRAPIGVSRDSVQGLSFSQYGPGASGLMYKGNAGKRPSLTSGAVVGTKAEAAKGRDSAKGTGSPAPTTPVDEPAKTNGNTEEETDSPDSASVYSFKSVVSASSTDTVVPPTSRRGSTDSNVEVLPESTKSPSAEEGLDSSDVPERGRRASISSSLYDLDFPMPPSYSPDRLSVNSAGSAGSNGVAVVPAITPLSLADLEIRSPGAMLGADEDVERPPPTPVVTGSPKITVLPSGSQSSRNTPRLSASSAFHHSHAVALLDVPSRSGWVDDEEEGVYSGSDSGDDTVYHSMSEEDYEDAVSMLSGMYYSASSSVEA